MVRTRVKTLPPLAAIKIAIFGRIITSKTDNLAAIIYYLTLPFIYLLSILPFPVLYALSDFLFVVFFYITGYRKKIVMQNLRNSFPEKSEAELKELARKFYHHLCDLFLETFKTLTISRKSMLKRCPVSPEAIALFTRMAEEKKSIVIVMGHKGNWEWAGNSFSICCPQQLYVIYHPLSNTYFNGLIYRMRCRFGTKLIAMQDTFRDMVKLRHEVNATAFIADQSPPPQTAHWMEFLNQDTPVFKGTEKIAQKLKYPVVYVSIRKVKRGYYELYAEELNLPDNLLENALTEIHTKILEKDIREQPETWLWSHRRWKHKRPEKA